MAQSLSYHPSNDQPIILSHRYSSLHMDRPPLPPLSQLIDNNNLGPTTTSASDLYYSAQPPSTILASPESSLASVDLFSTAATGITTPSATATSSETVVDPSSCMLTTAPQTMPETLSTMYMNDPSSTVAATESLMYGPTMLPTTTSSPSTATSLSSSPSSSLLSNATMNPLLSTTATSAAMVQPSPYLYPTANGPSPPPPYPQGRHRQDSVSSSSSDKVYSFVAIPGMNQRKRPRRRYDEIERLYHCTFPGCKKSYGTLNHLNSHVLMQSHGPKRHPSEFKEMRKEWRRIRKQREAHKKQAEQANKQQQEQCQQQQQHQLLQQQQLQQHQLHTQPILTTPFQPPFISSDATNYPLQSMPMSGFY